MSDLEITLFVLFGIAAVVGCALGIFLFEEQVGLRSRVKSAEDAARDSASRARAAQHTAYGALMTKATGGATKEDIVRLETAITNLTALLCDEEAPE